jgi:hypothetical protein
MSNEPLVDRESAIAFLRKSVCKVVFTKADGTERILYATLKSEYLPERTIQEAEEQAQKPQRKPRPDNTLAVWDVEASAWKSFRLDSVTAFSTDSIYGQREFSKP